MKTPIHVCVATDGADYQIACIGSLLSGFRSLCSCLAGVAVVCPQEVESKIKNDLGFLRGRVVTGPISRQDPYYIQMGIYAAIAELPSTHMALCLDYDHILFDTSFIDTFPVAKGTIFTGSAVRPAANLDLPLLEEGDVPLPAYVQASLIYGNVADLRKGLALWRTSYDRLSNIPVRCRCEYALSLSCASADMTTLAIPSIIQGSFDNSNFCAHIFHYGGLTDESQEFKTVARRLVEQQLFLPEDPSLRAIHLNNDLKAELNTFISGKESSCT